MPITVLIADDDPSIIEILAAVLDEEGYAVERAFDGRQALELVHTSHPDIIVTDVAMPRLDGVALTQALRARGDSTPVVLMSAIYADVDLPGVRFVPKPFDLDAILTAIERTFAEAYV